MCIKMFSDSLKGNIEDLLNDQVLKLFRFPDLAAMIIKLGVPEYRYVSLAEIKRLLPTEGGRIVALESDLFFMDGDILFKARLPSGGERYMVINFEAQNASSSSKRTINRMVFYAAAFLVDQYGKVYEHQKYEDLIKVTSHENTQGSCLLLRRRRNCVMTCIISDKVV